MKGLVTREKRRQQCMNRFYSDFINKDFIPLKILFFFMYGGMTTMFPFQTIQARSLGITVEELGIIYSLLPVVGVLAPAFAGMIADKIGNFKIFLALMVTLSGLAALLFLLIPPGRVTHTLPEELPLSFNCTGNTTNFSIKQPFTCDFTNISNTKISVQRCKYICSDNVQPQLSVVNLKQQSWCSITENCNMLPSNVSEIAVVGTTSSPNNTKSANRSVVTLEADLFRTESVSELRLTNQLCPDVRQLTNKLYYSHASSVDTADTANGCWLQCDASTPRKPLCQNTESVEDLNAWLTLAAYTAVRFLNGFTFSTSLPLFEGAAVVILNEHKGDFGYQRLYANLGMIIMAPISGKIIDVVSAMTGKEDFSSTFYMYCAVQFLCAFIILFINLEFKKPSNNVIKDMKALVYNPRVICFMLFTFVSGTCYGFVETFLFWLLEDLNADKRLMGITLTVGGVFGVPLLMFSTAIIKRLGHIGTLCMSMAVYVIRLTGYSLIHNPWTAMPFEAMESFTNSLIGVTSVSYAAVLCTPTTAATLQGIYAGTYHGVGRGAGSLIGGFLIKTIGIRSTFQVLAGSCAVAGVVYYSVYWFIFRRNDKKKEAEDTAVENGNQTATGEKNCRRQSLGCDNANDAVIVVS